MILNKPEINNNDSWKSKNTINSAGNKLKDNDKLLIFNHTVERTTITFPRIGWNELLFLGLALPSDLL